MSVDKFRTIFICIYIFYIRTSKILIESQCSYFFKVANLKMFGFRSYFLKTFLPVNGEIIIRTFKILSYFLQQQRQDWDITDALVGKKLKAFYENGWFIRDMEFYSWGVQLYLLRWNIRLNHKRWLWQCSGNSFVSKFLREI